MQSTNIGSIPAIPIYANTRALPNLTSSPVYSQDKRTGASHSYCSFICSLLGTALGSSVKGLWSQCRKCLSTGSRKFHPVRIKTLALPVLVISYLVMLVQFVFCNGHTSDIKVHLVSGSVPKSTGI